MDKRDLTIQQAADVLAVSWDTVRRAIADGSLDAYRVRRQWRIRSEALKEYRERA